MQLLLIRSLKLILLLSAWSAPGFAADEPERRMAISFDDLPVAATTSLDIRDRRDVTQNILQALTSRSVPAIGFVNESKLYADDKLDDAEVDLLRLWLSAGFELGNHSYSHPDLHRVSLAEFQADVERGDAVIRNLLAERGELAGYFRHPFLHTGRDLATKRALEAFLNDRGYAVAPVTIDSSEWIFGRAYDIALARQDDALAARIGADYVEYMLSMVAFYEDQSQQLFDRNIAHVLLVHTYQLNADWFGALADRLTAIGYEFITLDEALKDPAYASKDTYTGPGGITWIHRWAISRDVDRAMFRGEPETPQYIRELTEMPEHLYPTEE